MTEKVAPRWYNFIVPPNSKIYRVSVYSKEYVLYFDIWKNFPELEKNVQSNYKKLND